MGLSQSHDQSCGFNMLIRVKSGHFLFFSMSLSQFDYLANGFGGLTRVIFYVFLIDFF